MTPYYQDDSTTIWHGDCVEVMAQLEPNSIDAIVTDPPYGLEFMGKQWDRLWNRGGDAYSNDKDWGDRPAGYRPRYVQNLKCAICGKWKRDRNPCRCENPDWQTPNKPDNGSQFARAMQEWHSVWAIEALRVLKPGGHMLAFGGTRTWHRLTVAIEDAGFEIRDGIAWLYGSGFPKSLDVSKAIDKAAGAEREPDEYTGANYLNSVYGNGMGGGVTTRKAEAATPEAQQWAGWGTALKPAFEPIVVARKPLTGTVAANVLAWGTGALNIDASRIGPDADTRRSKGNSPNSASAFPHSDDNWIPHLTHAGSETGGRWPANVALDQRAAALLDEQSGELVSGSRQAGDHELMGYHGSDTRPMPAINGDSGGASRFMYTAKADSGERITHNGTSHPTVKPLDLMRWLIRLITPPAGTVLDPFAGSGTTAEAALLEGFQCIAIEREGDYLPLITQRIHRRRDPIAYLTEGGHDLGLFADDEAP